MKIAYVTTYDATDRNALGGRGYYMARSLNDQSTALEYIGPLEEKYSWLLKSKEYIYNNRVVKKRYTRERDRLLIMDYARQISRKLSGLDVDVIFSPMSLGSQPVAYLECKQPIVIWTDATFAGALDFYPHLRSSMLCKETISAGIANERAVLNRCDLAIYWSEWAAQTAIEHYQIDPAKVKVVPVGPNLECHRDLDDIRAMVDSRPSHTCKLLFLGMEWHRKGGDIAFEVAKELNNTGLNTELTVVGCQPLVDEPLPSYVKSLRYGLPIAHWARWPHGDMRPTTSMTALMHRSGARTSEARRKPAVLLAIVGIVASLLAACGGGTALPPAANSQPTETRATASVQPSATAAPPVARARVPSAAPIIAVADDT